MMPGYLDRGAEFRENWVLIPAHVDVLLTAAE